MTTWQSFWKVMAGVPFVVVLLAIAESLKSVELGVLSGGGSGYADE